MVACKHFFLALCLFIVSVTSVFSYTFVDVDYEKYIERTNEIMIELLPVADYISQNDDVDDEYLHRLRNDIGKDKEEMNSMLEKVESNLSYRNNQLEDYSKLIKQRKDGSSNAIRNEIVKNHYEYLQKTVDELTEAKIYIQESLEVLQTAKDRLFTLRTKARNKYFLEQDMSIFSRETWQDAYKETVLKLNMKNVSSLLIPLALGVLIYLFCSRLLILTIKLVRKNVNLSRDKRVIFKLSVFFRIFWFVFVASGLMLMLTKISKPLGWINDYASYMVCLFFVIQTLQLITLRAMGIGFWRKNFWWSRFFIIVLVTLLALQKIDLFVVTTTMTPVFENDGNTVISSILALILLIIALVVVRKTRVPQTIGVRRIRVVVALTMIVGIAVLFFVLSLAGFDNLATGIMVKFLQIQLTLVAVISLYNIVLVLMYVLAVKFLKSSNYVEDVFARIRNASNETVGEYWLRLFLKITFSFACVILILVELGIPYQQILDNIFKAILDGVEINGQRYFSLVGIFQSILLLVVCLLIGKMIQRTVAKHILPYIKVDLGTQRAIDTAIGYLVIFIALLTFIYSFGISGTSLAFILSGLSVGFGFALQDLIKNFFSGLMLLAERPVKIGDWVNIHGDIGEVKKIRIRATIIETFNHNTLIIPNAVFMSDIVSNETFNPMTRMVIKVKVGFNEDPDRVSAELCKVALEHKKVYRRPKPSVMFERYGEYALEFTLRAFCPKLIQYDTASELRGMIIKRFRELGIEIPINTSNILISK